MLFVTVPPMASHRTEIARHRLVDALRFNTGMPIDGSPAEKLLELRQIGLGKPIWVDLKDRQLRIEKWSRPEYDHVELNHAIEVRPGALIYFRGVDKPGRIAATKDNKIILDGAPAKLVGAGQAVNIPDESLVVHGFFTDRDLEYIAAAKEVGIHRYMISFAEEIGDIEALLELDPEAKIILKIESRQGLALARDQRLKEYPVRLMLARDDLYQSLLEDPALMLAAEQELISLDQSAIAASRLFASTEYFDRVSLADYHEIQSLRAMGYQHFMLSDDLCTDPDRWRIAIEAYRQALSM